ncbi:MAG TPA: metalloregulator ArsR/SmtB family transcription factor [Phycisphaerae bacterium]|nr:metalloregulator ArsR/SmtB family transcription factor [Phycisphaerae bacterium]
MVTTSKSPQPVFKALADPTRREILRLLRARPLSVGQLAANFSSSRPAISKHLRLLRSAGLVATTRRGASHICRLNPRPLRAVDTWLRDYQSLWNASLHNLKHFLEDHP